MSELCRLCSLPFLNTCHLFTESSLFDCHRLLSNIKLFIGLDIKQGDTLPTHVCWNCAQKISEIEIFVNNCMGAQEKLERLCSTGQIIKEEGDCEEKEEFESNEFQQDHKMKTCNMDAFKDPSKLLHQHFKESMDGNSEDSEKQESYSCPVCNKQLVEKNSVKKHLDKIHYDTDGNLFANFLDSIGEVPKCKTCRIVCKDNLDLLEHNKMHESTACPKTVWHIRHKSALTIERLKGMVKGHFSQEEQDMYLKLINEGKDQEIYCKVFGNIFANVPQSKRETKNWICVQCEGGYFTGKSQDFEAHFASHDVKSIKFTCELCSAMEPSLPRFQVHLKKRHFTDVKCEYCGDILESLASYGVHKVRVHNVDAVPCPYCEKSYSSAHHLNAHISRSHGNKTYVCSICAKDFQSQEGCKAHEKTHSDVMFSCKYCDNSYKCKAALKRHIKLIHTTTFETYSCERCGKTFNEPRKLNLHMKIHDGHPDLTCDICGKISSSKFSARQHKDRVHFKIKNFQCSACPFASAAKDKLNLHMKKVHENEHETCFVCHRQVKHLYHHVRQAHKDGPALWDQFMKSKQAPVMIIQENSQQIKEMKICENLHRENM